MKAFFVSLALMCSVTFVNAQSDATSQAPVTNQLQSQFNRLKSNSNSYQEYKKSYKVVEVDQLDSFWNNVQKAIKSQERNLKLAGKATEEELLQTKATIAEQKKQIEALKQENAIKEQAAQQNAYEVANIIVFGVGINKQVFMFASFGVILLLIIVAGVMAALFKNSKKVTDEKVRAYQEVENELTEYKKTARERELRIKRELQTELNHKEELLQELAKLRPHHA